MVHFLLRRTGYGILVVLGVLLVTFVLFNLAAGDPAAALLGDNASPGEIEQLRRELGSDLPILYGKACRTEAFAADLTRNFATADTLIAKLELRAKTQINGIDFPPGIHYYPIAAEVDKIEIFPRENLVFAEVFREQGNPFNSQFFRSLGEIVKFKKEFPHLEFFDFGKSLSTREPIRQIIARGVGPSLALMIPVFFGEIIFGVLFALIAAAKKDKWQDRVLLFVSVLGMSISFLVAIIFGQWFLGYYWQFFPIWGWGDWRYLCLPVLLAIVCGIGGNVRFYRAVFVEELKSNYLRSAKAKGCAPGRIYGVHLLRNALIPIITRSSAALPFLFTGSLLLESFFGIPGLGYAGVEALNNSDLQLLKALVIVGALLFVFFNLMSDLAYAWADPRIRLGK